MPDPEPFTTSLPLTAGEFAALHEQVLANGARAAEYVLDPCGRTALAELVAWLPDLTAEAYDDAIIARGRRTLPAAGAWLADAALSRDDPRDAAAVRARAAELARARLSAHAGAEPPTELVQACAHALACALEPTRAATERRELIAAVHGELLALAVLRTRPAAPPPVTDPPTRGPSWTPRGAARVVLQCADVPEARCGWLVARDPVAVAILIDDAGRVGLTGIVSALPALALDAIWLDCAGAGLDARAARKRLVRTNARAAAALFHALCALEEAGAPRTRHQTGIATTERLRLVETAEADADDSPVLVGIDRCAQALADALSAGPTDELTPSLWILAGELAAVVALTNACHSPGAARRHTTPLRRAPRGRGGRQRR